MMPARPPIGLALALGVCALAQASAAQPSVARTSAATGPAAAGAPSASLHVAFTPDRAGARTTIELSLKVRGDASRPQPALRSLALRLPAGMGIATTTLGEANCSPVSLIAGGLSGCSPNALLGFGAATAVVPVGTGAVFEHAALYPLMGPPRENQVEVLFYVQANSPVFAQLVLPAVLAEDVPPYGERLQTAIPLVEVWPEGPDLALASIDSTIGPLHLTYRRRVGSRTVSFRPQGIRIPAQCTRGGYPFAAELGFVDGAGASASFHVPCPRP
jgi:hypothetical protein